MLTFSPGTFIQFSPPAAGQGGFRGINFIRSLDADCINSRTTTTLAANVITNADGGAATDSNGNLATLEPVTDPSGDVVTVEGGGRALPGAGVAATLPGGAPVYDANGNVVDIYGNIVTTGAPPIADASEDDKDASGSMLVIIMGVIIGLLVCVVIAVVLFRRSRDDDNAKTTRQVAQFENPMYEETPGSTTFAAFDDGANATSGYTTMDGAPDATGATAGYKDIPKAKDDGYLDVDAQDDTYDAIDNGLGGFDDGNATYDDPEVTYDAVDDAGDETYDSVEQPTYQNTNLPDDIDLDDLAADL